MTASADNTTRSQSSPRRMKARTVIGSVCLLLLTAIMTGCGANPRWIGKFERAQEELSKARTQAQYEDVARRYEEMLDEGAQCGAVYSVLGNAYVKAGKPGRAIAAYRQAQRYWPTHSFLQYNLQSTLGDNAPADESKPLIENLLFWQNWISYPGKFRLAAVVALLTFALGVGAIFAKSQLQPYIRRAAWVGLVFSGLFILSATYDWYRFDYQQHGVVITPEVVVRKGYSTESKPAFTKPLLEGTEFRVRQNRGDWLLIELPDNQKGWIPNTTAQTY